MAKAFSVTYRIGPGDIITHLDDNWHSFAEKNWQPSARPHTLVGSSLWDHICDPTTEYLYREILNLVRGKGKAMAFDFRCDSPKSKRFMKMEISPLAKGQVEFKSTLLHEEALSLSGSLASIQPKALIPICSWCKKVRVEDGDEKTAWQELDQAAHTLGIFESCLPAQVTHTICEQCHMIMRDQITAYKEKA